MKITYTLNESDDESGDEISTLKTPPNILKFLGAVHSNKITASTYFEQLTSEEKAACGQECLYRKTLAIPLFSLLESSLNDKNLILQLLELTPPDILVENRSPRVLFYLFSYKGVRTLVNQHEILKLVIAFLKKKQLEFDLLPILQQAFRYGSSDAADRFLCEYKNQIPVTDYPQILTLANESGQLQCIQTLINWGAKLEQKHTQSLIVKLKKSKKALTAEEAKAMEKLLKIFKTSNLSFPLDTCLLTSGNIKIKTQILSHFLKNCDLQGWQLLEDKILELKFSYISVTLVKLCFSNKFPHRLAHPQKFTDFAAMAVRYRNSIIEELMEKGVKLNQKIEKFGGVTIPAFENTISHLVAFYPSPKKLHEKLITSAEVNLFHRTSAHYAALAISSLLDKPKAKTSNRNRTPSNKNRSDTTPNLRVQEFEKDFYWCEKFFHTEKTGSLAAFKATDPNQWHTSDIVDFSPIDYAAMHAHGADGKNIVKHASKPLLQALNQVFTSSVTGATYLLPRVLLEIITQYLITCEQPDEVAISWAKKMISKENLFEARLQELIIQPLKKYCNDEYRTSYYEQALQGIRIAQQLFTFFTLWDFESFGVNPIYTYDFPPHINKDYGLKRPRNSIPWFSNQNGPEDYFTPISMLSQNSIWEEEKADDASSSNYFSFFSTAMEVSSPKPALSLKSRKRPQPESDDDFPQISWKKRRETLVESLQEIYQTGSRIKYELRKVSEQYITKLIQARNEQAMEQAVTDMKDAYYEPESKLKNIFEKYGLASWLAKTLNIEDSQTSSNSWKL